MSVAGIDKSAVSAWLAKNIAGAEPPFRFDLIKGGNSNLTFRVAGRAGPVMALRRPPLGQVLATAHDMPREFRVISALADTEVPVPPALGLCESQDVNGAPFYVMGFVEGVTLHDVDTGRQIPPEERVLVGEGVVDALAALHLLSPDEIGLGDLGKRQDYVARQIYRWARQWEATKQREVPEMEEARVRLEAGIPVQERTSVVHGDFRLGNMIADQGRVQAVVDWELCTLGDPMADLGYLANDWANPGEQTPWLEPVTMAGGFPAREEMLSRYTRLTGADLSGIGFYRAFQAWRLAAILEGVYARYLHGGLGSTKGVDLAGIADAVLHLARWCLEQMEV